MANKKTQITGRTLHKEILVLSIFLISLIFSLASCGVADVPSCNMASVPRLAHDPSRVEIRDGTIMVNGQPFFPFGFYHVSWKSTAKQRMNHLSEIAAAGFNTIHASATALNEYEKFLDRAEQLGIYVLSEQNVGLLKLVNTFKHKRAILGWNIADDVDNGRFTPARVLDLHCQAKKADPNHITYISGHNDQKISKFINSADAIAVQAYPVGNKYKLPLSWASHIVSIAHRAAPKNRSIIANVQAFRWHDKNAPLPTSKEVRNMTYQSLLAGAKGIIYYTYYDETWELPKHPELWKSLKSLVPEIKVLSSFLLKGNLRKIYTGAENILVGIWTDNSQDVLVVLNTSKTTARKVSVPLPLRRLGAVKSMFSGRPSGLVIQDNQLLGLIEPLDVQVYRFNL